MAYLLVGAGACCVGVSESPSGSICDSKYSVPTREGKKSRAMIYLAER